MISSPVMSMLDIILKDGNHIPWLRFGTGPALYIVSRYQGFRTAALDVVRHNQIEYLEIRQLNLNILLSNHYKSSDCLTSISSWSMALLRTKGRVDWRRYGLRWSRWKVKGLPNLLECPTSNDLEEILPGAIPSVNQLCRNHLTGEDYPMILY